MTKGGGGGGRKKVNLIKIHIYLINIAERKFMISLKGGRIQENDTQRRHKKATVSQALYGDR